MNPVRFHPDLERVLPDEAAALDELSVIFRRVQEHVLEKSGDAKRGTHSKATALLKGELIVADGLPPELVQGLFARPGSFDTLVRFAQGPSENLSDKASGQRGLSMKVLGVEGPHVAGSRETTTQDWVLAVRDSAFTDGTAQAFLRSFRYTGAKATFVPQAAIIAASRLSRGVEAVLEAAGTGGSAHLRFFGKAPTHPASDAYFSQAPFRYGEYVAQMSAVPTPETVAAIGDPTSDTRDNDVFRHQMETLFEQGGAEFDIRIQLCTDLERMPVEDASVPWPEELSPHRTVARLRLPAQPVFGEGRRRYMDERLAFNPIHALEVHRPLGSIMRARMRIYLETQDFRQASDGVAPAEPRSCAELPD